MPAVEELTSAKKRKLEDVKMEEGVSNSSPQSLTESERSCEKEKPTEAKEELKTRENDAAKSVESTAESPNATNETQKTAIRRLLEPFSREQLVEILANAATRYDALYTELKAAAGADVAHRKVFVRGLAWETKTEHLKEAFAAFGDVQEGAVIYDKATGKSRGFGFVTFVEMEAAQCAVQQQTIVIDVRWHAMHETNFVVVSDKSTNLAMVFSCCIFMVCRAGKQVVILLQFGLIQTIINTHYRSHINCRLLHPRMDKYNNLYAAWRHLLFVRGLSWDTTDDTLRHEFQKFGDLEEAMIARDRQTNRSKGYGFVTYKHKAGAERALQVPQKFIDGRKTVCNLACQGHNKPHTEQRGGGSALLAPVAPSYPMPMQPV
ncbi:hypothetical protein BBO99_00005583, partial [Phytophthora kernoviae]